MLVERKCLGCGTWVSTDVCPKCGLNTNPKKIRVDKIREIKSKKEAQNSSRLELILKKWKNTKNPFFKMSYWIGYSIWLIYMAILSFFAFIIAWGPG